MPAEALALTLLRAAARSNTLSASGMPEAQVRHALDLGLGALLYAVIDGDVDALLEPVASLVEGAEMTARFREGLLSDAACEILDQSPALRGPVTLIKGISIADQHYPAPHQRMMCDIDLLLLPTDLEAFQDGMRALGYLPEVSDLPDAFYETHHHSRPFQHPLTGVRVEAHTALFPPRTGLTDGGAFAPAHVASQLRPGEYRGRPVRRLSNELQLLFLAAHWAHDARLPFVANGPLDAIYLLRNVGDAFDWDTLFRWIDDRRVGTPLAVLLRYLEARELLDIDPDVRRHLAELPDSAGGAGLRVLHGIVDRALESGFGGRRVFTENNASIAWKAMLCARPSWRNLASIPYRVLFPPEHPRRYTLKFQLDRLLSVLR